MSKGNPYHGISIDESGMVAYEDTRARELGLSQSKRHFNGPTETLRNNIEALLLVAGGMGFKQHEKTGDPVNLALDSGIILLLNERDRSLARVKFNPYNPGEAAFEYFPEGKVPQNYSEPRNYLNLCEATTEQVVGLFDASIRNNSPRR